MEQGNGWGGPSSSSDEGGSSWAKVVGGQPRQASWTAHKVSDEDVDELRQYFTKILEFPKEEMDEARGEWYRVAVLARCLGGRVPVEWVTRDFKVKGKLTGKLEACSLAEDHLLFRFKTEEERDSILRGGLWVLSPASCWLLRPGCRISFRGLTW